MVMYVMWCLTLCRYDLRNSDLFDWSWARVRQVKHLFRAAIVWWRCAQYFVIASLIQV